MQSRAEGTGRTEAEKNNAASHYLNWRNFIMKLAVVCANGKAGKLIVKEAVSRGLDVTAVVREENQTAAQKVLKKGPV